MGKSGGTHYNHGNEKAQADLLIKIDNLIDEHCNKKGMKRKEFFRIHSINYSSYRNYQRGTRIPFDIVASLADALGVSIDELRKE